ncbi:hypothetical protein SteCoe_1453 [Stentor coeruleus]|uniref:Uncharacterized protein n=1 Tax=Stentor coeruleus TaxID=5963 RepID=A0A1R2D1T5_9CILI|nr:hypothetical protein SteCoe_1453 [Stentor coeruleus]
MSTTEDSLGKFLKTMQPYIQNSQNHTIKYFIINPLIQFSDYKAANFAELNDYERLYFYAIFMKSYMTNQANIPDPETLRFLFDTICLYIGDFLEEFLKEFMENILLKIQNSSTVKDLYFCVSFIISEKNYNFCMQIVMSEIENKFKQIVGLGLKNIRNALSIEDIKEMIELLKALTSLNIDIQQETQILAVLIMNSTEYWLVSLNYGLNDNEKMTLSNLISLFEDARMLLKNFKVKSFDCLTLKVKKLLNQNNQYAHNASYFDNTYQINSDDYQRVIIKENLIPTELAKR